MRALESLLTIESVERCQQIVDSWINGKNFWIQGWNFWIQTQNFWIGA
ncbi:hypothetical protein [Fictibacillus arsenicus]|nr:hypothetical protein [Fictibacillus arsenicus]